MTTHRLKSCKAEEHAPLDDRQIRTTTGRIRVIEIALIRTDDDIQTRVSVDANVVGDYAEAMDGGIQLPPLVVYHDCSDYWLADGFHRLAAAREACKTSVAVELRDGGKLDALRHALGANASHGLRRTNADKRRCAELALKHFGNQSDRALGELCGVGHQLVGEVRSELDESSSSRVRVGRDGKTRRSLLAKSNTATKTPRAQQLVRDEQAPALNSNIVHQKSELATNKLGVVIVDGSKVVIAPGIIDAGALTDHLKDLESRAVPATSAQRDWLAIRERLTAELALIINGTLGDQPALEALRAGCDAICWLLTATLKELQTRQKGVSVPTPTESVTEP